MRGLDKCWCLVKEPCLLGPGEFLCAVKGLVA